MNFVQVSKTKGDKAMYDEFIQKWSGGQLPDGETLRLAGPGKDGWFYVIDVWNDRKLCDEAGEKAFKVLQEMGADTESMTLEEFEVHELKTS